MARPANPETIAALKKRVAKLEDLVLGLLERQKIEWDGLIAEPPRLAALIKELDDALGMSPGTLERRVTEALVRDPQSAA